MKIALYKSARFGYEAPHEVTSNYEDDDDYFRSSEITEVDFVSLDNETLTKNEVAVIDKKITDVFAKSEMAINELKQRKAELLAITDMSGE